MTETPIDSTDTQAAHVPDSTSPQKTETDHELTSDDTGTSGPPAATAQSSFSKLDNEPAPASAPSTKDEGEHVDAVDHDGDSGIPPANDTTAAADPSQAQSQNQDTADHGEQYSPEVMSLCAMFPSLDPVIVHSVLESVGGSQERATDVLLGMSDPEYVSQETHEQRPSAPSQTDLDEEFARRLVMEDQQRQSDWENQLGYQPRRRSNSERSGDGGKDTMTELSEQFNKFAETSSVQLGKFAESSKKTLSSLMTKVKAKVQEFDSNRNNQGSGSSNQQQQSWDTEGPTQQAQYYQPPSEPPNGGLNQEYNLPQPNPPSGVAAAPFLSSNYPAPKRVPVPPVDISDTTSTGQALGSSDTSSGTPKPPSTNTGTPLRGIDRAKLGMLPKRPVSLSQTTPAGRQDDEDELDYVENPFEEGRH